MKKLLGLRKLSLSLCLGFTIAGNAAPAFPGIIPLPVGWGPEGIAIGRGAEFYAGARQGSPFVGAVYKGDLRTGTGTVLVPPQPGRFALGLKLDQRSNLLFVAGGPGGRAFVYDGSSGEDVAAFPFAVAPTFVNDVVITRTAAYFTDSLKPVLYRVPLSAGGALPNPLSFDLLPLGGDYAMVPGFNANGIAATSDGSALIIVQSATGILFRVDPETGHADAIDLGGALVTNGDGILLHGRRLYVCRNAVNRIAVVELDPTLTVGSYVEDITSPGFSVPTTIAEFGHSIYAVNARFGLPIPGTEYQIVRVSK
jgi:sugar lactone lactonase YvrE